MITYVYLYDIFQAEACKSVEYAMKKCPNGMFSEIKYDGERVQVHKQGNEFRYYSRSLKPVMPHKVWLLHHDFIFIMLYLICQSKPQNRWFACQYLFK